VLEALDNTPGPVRDIVILNAGTALYAAGVASSIGEGLLKAREALASGAARNKLQQFIQTTQRLGAAHQAST
jgi:anthranilate phosphoribosyltransferase